MATLDGNYIDPTNVSARQTGIRWGLILGLIGVILSLFFYFTGLQDFSGKKPSWLPWLAITITNCVCIWYAQVQHRDNELGGYLTLGRAITVGLWVCLIAGVISMVYMVFFSTFMVKDLAQTMINGAVENAENSGQDGEKARSRMEMMKWFFSPLGLAVSALIGKLFSGLILGLLVGLVTKRESSKPF